MPSSPRSPDSLVESHHRSSPVAVPANDLGKPASCVVEELRLHLVMSRLSPPKIASFTPEARF